jgi:hypothetical protein
MPRTKSDSETGDRAELFKFRVSTEEKAILEAAAGGEYAGTWARRELLAAAKRLKTKATRKKRSSV